VGAAKNGCREENWRARRKKSCNKFTRSQSVKEFREEKSGSTVVGEKVPREIAGVKEGRNERRRGRLDVIAKWTGAREREKYEWHDRISREWGKNEPVIATGQAAIGTKNAEEKEDAAE
jgi:hypothetical protein